MIFKVTNSEGVLLRSGICQPVNLSGQARDGEIASESSEEELEVLKQAVVDSQVLPSPLERESAVTQMDIVDGDGKSVTKSVNPAGRPVDQLAVLVRALQNAGVSIYVATAEAELIAERALQEQQVLKVLSDRAAPTS